MPILSNCPKCEQPVTVPDGVDPAGQVRCPLCDAEYPLSEAMASVPPALIPVNVTPSNNAAPAETEPAGEGLSLDSWGRTHQSPEIDTGVQPDAAPAIDTGAAAVDSDAFAGFTPEGESAGEPESLTAAMAKRRERGKQKSLGREMPKIIGGGVMGLIIGYYLLNIIGGQQYDKLKIYLPFVEHTQNNWPFGGDGGEEQPSDDADNGKQQPSKKKPAAKKPNAQASGTSNRQPQLIGEDELTDPGELEDPIASLPPIDSSLITEPDITLDPGTSPKIDVGPKNPPSFTSDELGKALKAADDAINGEGATGEMTEEAYGHSCRLARLLTFAAAGPQLIDRELAVRGLLEDLAEKPGQFDRIAGLAGALWDGEQGAEDGILLAGTVEKVGEKGGLHAIVVKLPQPYDKSVLLLKGKSLFIEEKDKVFVLGSIVDDPQENIAGYTGSQKRVIWAGMAQVLPR